MGLETGVNYIADLVATNPAFGDVVSQGDDHLRNVKRALQASFPKMAGIVNDVTASTGSTLTISSTKNNQIYSSKHTGTAVGTIPAASTVGRGFVLTIINNGVAATDVVDLTLSGADAFLDGNTTYEVRRGVTITLISDGTSKWHSFCGDVEFWKGYYRALVESSRQIGFDYIELPLANIILPGSAVPAAGSTAGANGITLKHYAFDPSTAEYAQWTALLPSAFSLSVNTAVYLELCWYTTINSPGSIVVWQAAAAIFGYDAAWDVVFGAGSSIVSYTTGAYFMHRCRIPIVPNVVSFSATAGKQIQIYLRRDATTVGDTLAADALLVSAALYYDHRAINSSVIVSS